MNQLLHTFISDPTDLEFEARIGKNATKINYNNVIQWLLMAGFTLESSSGIDLLRIQESETRVELTGTGPIQYYCRTQKLVNPVIIKKEKLGDVFIEDYWTYKLDEIEVKNMMNGINL
jgi:hypothetical protein